MLGEGKRGICRVRKNRKGKLYSENYGKVCSLHFDPIEKKPLYHFSPGGIIFSIGSVGCNMACNFCQNHEISQTDVDSYPYLKNYSPAQILKIASQRHDNLGIAYTYNEPTVWYDFMLEIAQKAQHMGLKNVVVSNGFINEQPLREICSYIDAFNIDLKAFNENFYKKQTHSHLAPVKKSLKIIRQEGVHLEITNLVITGLNDKEREFREMVQWISQELGSETVLHLSRYFPRHKASHEPTPASVLLNFKQIAEEFLDYVYLGNIVTGKNQNTYCKHCGKLLVKRDGYATRNTGATTGGKCRKCGAQIFAT